MLYCINKLWLVVLLIPPKNFSSLLLLSREAVIVMISDISAEKPASPRGTACDGLPGVSWMWEDVSEDGILQGSPCSPWGGWVGDLWDMPRGVHIPCRWLCLWGMVLNNVWMDVRSAYPGNLHIFVFWLQFCVFQIWTPDPCLYRKGFAGDGFRICSLDVLLAHTNVFTFLVLKMTLTQI